MMITSPRNPQVAAAVGLHRARVRRIEGRTLLEGPNLLEAAVAAGTVIETVFALAGNSVGSLPPTAVVYEVSREVLDRLAPTDHPRGPIAVIAIPEPAGPSGGDALVLWGVADPGNVGTLIRTAAAFGLDAIIGPGCADPWAPKVLRAGAGGHFATRLARIEEPSALLGAGLTLAATTVSGGIDPGGLPAGPVGVVIGSEAHGLPSEVVAACGLAVTIAMPGRTESLNAASAGAIMAYELARRRR